MLYAGSLRMFDRAENQTDIFSDSFRHCTMDLTANMKSPGSVTIQKGVFHGEILSLPYLSVYY